MDNRDRVTHDDGLVPHPFHSYEEELRFSHRDLATRSPEQIWAEKVLVTIALASRIHWRAKQRIITRGDGEYTTDVQWLSERLEKLQAVRRRRAAA